MEHTCAISATLSGTTIPTKGSLWCWGENFYGENGIGNKVLSAASVREATLSNNWVTVQLGDNHSCGLQSQPGKTGFSLWCWGGRSFERQIGDLRLVDLMPKLVL